MSLSPPVKRVLIGRPLESTALRHTLLPKWLALPVFCSDPLSSVAYATDEILLVLVLGGATALTWTPWVGLAVAALLVIVVLSYRKTVYAYPGGGGAYAVAKDTFGQNTALVAASALTIDYILTVAVSVTSGVANFASAFPSLAPHVLVISLGTIVLITVANLRGVKESGRAFAVPTYGFIASVLVMLIVAVVKMLFGHPVVAASSHYPVQAAHVSAAASVFLLLRAFSSGCTALTGVEAISNGVPFFRRPAARNASITLAGMGTIAVVMFGGVTLLAVHTHIHIADDPTRLGLPAGTIQPTVMAQLGSAVFGSGAVPFYLLQSFTALVLVLAANTAFNSFPILASVLGRDGYLPKQLGRRGDRLVFSNGIIALAGIAMALVAAFDASVTRLIQLYILGVFLSFTISQAGMVVYWTRALRTTPREGQGRLKRSRAVNAVGATVTAVVLVVVTATKFLHGAWIVVLAIPLFLSLMLAIHTHYARSDRRLTAAPGGVRLPSRVHAVVLVSRINAQSMQALAYARGTRPSSLTGLHVVLDEAVTQELKAEWTEREIPVPLEIVDSPFRDLTGPVVDRIRRIHRASPRDLVAVFVPEQVVLHWWEGLLHNRSASRLRTRLKLVPGVVVVSVPLAELPGADAPLRPVSEHRDLVVMGGD